MAGLIESINWTNAATTKLNNAQWRWLRAGQRNPPAMTKTAQTHCAVCSKLLTWGRFLGHSQIQNRPLAPNRFDYLRSQYQM
jgi:hypothetical protein